MVPHSNWWSLIKLLRCRRLPELHYNFFFFHKNENNFAKSTSNHEGADQKGRGNFLNNNLQNNWNVIFFHLIKYSKQRRIKKKARKNEAVKSSRGRAKKNKKTSKLFYFDVKIIGHSRLCERERGVVCAVVCRIVFEIMMDSCGCTTGIERFPWIWAMSSVASSYGGPGIRCFETHPPNDDLLHLTF